MGSNSSIHKAVHDNDIDRLERLISRGGNIEERDDNGNTPLGHAARKGKLYVLKSLVGMKANIEAEDKKGYTPLIWAAYGGELDVVKSLVGMKANIEAKDNDGDTPLSYAARMGKLDVVKSLVGMKANIEAKDIRGKTALDWAKKRGHSNIVAFLRNHAKVQKTPIKAEENARQKANEAQLKRKEAGEMMKKAKKEAEAGKKERPTALKLRGKIKDQLPYTQEDLHDLESKTTVSSATASSAGSMKFGGVQMFPPEKVKKTGDLGEGQFGKVFRVEIPIDGKKTVAAMKRIGNETNLSKDLLSELLILSKLKPHPNLLLFYGIVTIDERVHFLSEFCEKGSLDALHKKEDFTAKERFWQVVGGVLSGLAAFHQSGLVHRDIACRNLFLKANGAVVLGDYGLSRSTQDDSKIYMMTNLKTLIPWSWCAPESLLQHEFSQKSDIWMFGVTVWEILTKGEKPHRILRNPDNFKNELRKGRMPLKIPNDTEVPPRAEMLLSLCFQFSIKNSNRHQNGNEKAVADWDHEDIVGFIKTFANAGNKKWAKCIEVVLEEELECSMLEDCDVGLLCEMGIPKICANSLLNRLKKKISEGKSSADHDIKEGGSGRGGVIVDSTKRPSASALIKKFVDWSAEDDCEYICDDTDYGNCDPTL